MYMLKLPQSTAGTIICAIVLGLLVSGLMMLVLTPPPPIN